ncbi:protein-s-isoprenylcysteine o-methyltransferase [Anaeramoeba flamelloides]|uniref:Protein-S-isoprenylcysteine O-methyltransferase n=1 Tax=Anaeramoeba flamelloides TaxID=1746091 RepID=A0ABQ8YJU7_9EUKA|nr:protein-s-isoprenylcysteine o-methyltransferase [Anaeramoeba flamelloides]
MLEKICNTVCLFGVIVSSVIRAKYRNKNKSQVVMDTLRRREIILSSLTLIATSALPVFHNLTNLFQPFSFDLPAVIRIFALFVFLLGQYLFILAHISLGTMWAPRLTIRKDHKLIRHGIYRYLRHPMYLATWILVVSQGFLLSNWGILILGTVVWAIHFFLRIGEEESMLEQEFGREYRDYKEKSGSLIPSNTFKFLAFLFQPWKDW